ncbi:hypothetical protein ACVWXL_001724 [Bradyrhizobium sp. GM22.5]
MPWTTRISTPARDLAQRVLLGADQGRDRHAVLPAHLDHGLRRHAERIGDQADRVVERDLQQLQRGPAIERLRLVVGDLGGREFDVVFLQEIARVVAVLLWHARLKALPGDVLLARSRDVFGDQHVDAVRLAVNVLVDPSQLAFERIRRVHGRT